MITTTKMTVVRFSSFLDEDTIPKYYLDVDLDDPNLKFGPIDEELDTYEAEETDFETW